MKKLICLFAIITGLTFSMSAQTYTKLYSARAQDTIRQSTTILSAPVSVLNGEGVKCLILQVASDSAKGTPDTKYVLQRSVDNVHFYSIAGDTLSPAYIGVNSVHPSVSAKLIVNPFSEAYARVKIYTGAGAQRTLMHVTIYAQKAGVK